MSKSKLRPCDCIDMFTASKLHEQGISHNDDSIRVSPNSVVITRGHTTMQIPMHLFKKFAEWYLTPQDIKDEDDDNYETDLIASYGR